MKQFWKRLNKLLISGRIDKVVKAAGIEKNGTIDSNTTDNSDI